MPKRHKLKFEIEETDIYQYHCVLMSLKFYLQDSVAGISPALHACSANSGIGIKRLFEFLNKNPFPGPEIGCVDQIVLIN